MSQVSYGTITITDTNDIESIVIEYNKNQSNQNPPSEGDSNWSTNRPTWQQGYYIWQRARIHKSGTATTADIIGTPVCVTGSTGEQGQPGTAGRSLTGVETKYCIYGTGTPSDSYSGWQDTIPEYNSSTPNYWVKVTNTYSSVPTTEVVKYKDTGITNAMAKAADAQSRAATAETNAANALSLSQATQQHFWFNSTTSGSIEAGAYITDTPIDTFKSGKNGGYLLARSDGVELGRGTNKFMTLSATALNFYRPGTNTIDATLTSKGLVLSKGGIEAGTKNTTNYIYIYSDDDATNHKLTINSHEASDWRIVAGKNFGVDKAGNLYASGANIQGQVTITSGSNVYTKTEADAAYDKKGAADSINVGGRNLWAYGSDCQNSLDGLNNLSNGFSIVTEDGYKCAHASGALKTTKYLQSKLGYVAKPSETFTYSCYVKIKNIVRGTTNPMCEFYFSGQTIDGSWKGPDTYKVYLDGELQTGGIGFDRQISDTKWHHFAVVGTYVNANFTATFLPNVYFRDCTGDLYVRNLKAERGNKATDWTPAPEDVQAEIDAKKSVHTLNTNYSYSYADILTYSAEGYGGTAGASWSVSSTEGVKQGDTVRIKVTVSDMSNTPVYIIGTVVSVTSATVLKAISHGLDSTIIDGGNILTNSIGANQIKANALTIGKIATAEQEKILNSKIEIGGRNLVWDTEWNHVSTRWSDWGSPTTREIVTINGKQWLHLVTTTTSHQGYSQAQDKRNGYGEIKAGDKVIISYSAYAKTAGQTCTVGCHWRNSSGTIVAQDWFSSTLTTTEKRYISAVFTIPNNAVGFNVMVGDGTANAQELWISQVKIEFGTKATDWTPAPEDIQSNAEDYADTVASIAKAELDATKIDAVGESTSLLDNINAISDQITLLASRINFGNITVADNLAQLNTAVSIDTATSTVYVGDQSNFHVRINGTELGFYQRAQRVAYINNNQLYITQSVVLQQMDLGTPVANGGLGQWSWKVHPNGKSPSRNNLNLKWIG